MLPRSLACAWVNSMPINIVCQCILIMLLKTQFAELPYLGTFPGKKVRKLYYQGFPFLIKNLDKIRRNVT